MLFIDFHVGTDVPETFEIDDLLAPVWEDTQLDFEDWKGFEAYEMEHQLYHSLNVVTKSSDYYSLWATSLGGTLSDVLDFLNNVLDYARDVPGATIGVRTDAE